jgi:hypothetical protein
MAFLFKLRQAIKDSPAVHSALVDCVGSSTCPTASLIPFSSATYGSAAVNSETAVAANSERMYGDQTEASHRDDSNLRLLTATIPPWL